MDRILALSLVGAGPGNVFGPGMSGGALESFFARGKAERGNGRGAAGGTGPAAGGGGGRSAAERTSEAEGGGGKSAAEPERTNEAEGKGVGGQERGGADANASFHRALDGMFFFEAVAPH
ncbi:hypothetical protein PAHAL_4G338400 [Panicum hallii]|uniref:Uncharacterized protein n=1 Tax=Panicum hallii TaxID=206008 RepID=A0A2S3HM54_9POAL|nr:glycine-rich cell wall structural protein 1-like [Panicum hallii]PAN25975.1 hypothetical protein PAHAL_4G338400 [Panicum hallii]